MYVVSNFISAKLEQRWRIQPEWEEVAYGQLDVGLQDGVLGSRPHGHQFACKSLLSEQWLMNICKFE